MSLQFVCFDSNICSLFSPFEDKHVFFNNWFIPVMCIEDLLTKIMRDDSIGKLWSLHTANSQECNWQLYRKVRLRRNSLNTLDILRWERHTREEAKRRLHFSSAQWVKGMIISQKHFKWGQQELRQGGEEGWMECVLGKESVLFERRN